MSESKVANPCPKKKVGIIVVITGHGRGKTVSNFSLLVLDEINNALKLKLTDLPQLLDLIENEPPVMHLIPTGRDAHSEVMKRVHNVTDMIMAQIGCQRQILSRHLRIAMRPGEGSMPGRIRFERRCP